jgi:hypothetical protein
LDCEIQLPCAAKAKNYSSGMKYFTPDIKGMGTILCGHAKSVQHIFLMSLDTDAGRVKIAYTCDLILK